jgi:PPOX class probable FMN-dependent enzyme
MTDSSSVAKITDKGALHEHYGEPVELAVACELDHLDEHHKKFIRRSPFVCISAAGADGQPSVSPKGDAPGFVEIIDDHTLLIPDRVGNNKVETFANIIDNPRVACIFFVPGLREMLRLWGEAEIIQDPVVLERGKVRGKLPEAALRIRINKAYFHCGKALVRSRLWDPESHVAPGEFPPFGQVLKDQARVADSAEKLQAGMDELYTEQLY